MSDEAKIQLPEMKSKIVFGNTTIYVPTKFCLFHRIMNRILLGIKITNI